MNLHSYIKNIRKDSKCYFTTHDIVEQFHVSQGHVIIKYKIFSKIAHILTLYVHWMYNVLNINM